jgi:hypothetical protein
VQAALEVSNGTLQAILMCNCFGNGTLRAPAE